MRFEFPDLGLVLNVAASEEPGHHLRWEFSDAVDWEPKLNLRMDSRIANAYLQGKESLAIAIARGRIRFDGDTRVRAALRARPAARRRRRTGGSSARSIPTCSSDAAPGVAPGMRVHPNGRLD